MRGVLYSFVCAAAMGACGRTAPPPRPQAPVEAGAAPWWEGAWVYDPEGLGAEPDFRALPPDAQDLARKLVESTAFEYRLTVTADRVVRERDAQRLDSVSRVEGGDDRRVSLRLDDGALIVLERTGPDRARVPTAETVPALPLRRAAE